MLTTGLITEVITCGFGAGMPGVQKSAEWVRTSFHDTITHDGAAGTGGLDASIQFELDRPENLGAALNNTLGDLTDSHDTRTSVADLLALSVVLAVSKCSDIRVPLSVGRIDATEAGPKGVPEANTDLDTTTKRFSMAGFNTTEMITLVACGHTLGGVHANEHPEIVTTGGTGPENVAHFDTTTDKFDNVVVTPYLSNKTANPLVVAKDVSQRSDQRVFGADGNVTMHRLADAKVFKGECERLLARMLDTVPKTVQLQPLHPADIRPMIDSYRTTPEGELLLTGRIRVRTTPGTGRDVNNLNVALLPKDRDGKALATVSTTVGTFQGGQTFGYFNEVFNWYEFNQTLKTGADAIKSFNVQLTGSKPLTSDNGGTGGFPLDPDLLVQDDATCWTWDSATNTASLPVLAAAHKDLVSANGAGVPQVTIVRRQPIPGSHITKLVPEQVAMRKSGKTWGDYELYETDLTLSASDIKRVELDIEFGASKLEYVLVRSC